MLQSEADPAQEITPSIFLTETGVTSKILIRIWLAKPVQVVKSCVAKHQLMKLHFGHPEESGPSASWIITYPQQLPFLIIICDAAWPKGRIGTHFVVITVQKICANLFVKHS